MQQAQALRLHTTFICLWSVIIWR